MVAKTVSEAIDWLEVNHTLDRFMLWVDMWDPHEPFDPPWYDWDRYRDPAYDGDKIIYPTYGRPNYLTEDEYKSLRALYAGKITLVDRWVGRLLKSIELLGLMRNTLVIWTTDHGHLFGEHNLQGKPSGDLGNLYEETARIPLIIRHPGGIGSGTRVAGLAQPPDLLPTVLEFAEVPIPDVTQGKSLWPLVTGEKDALRTAAFSARFPESGERRTFGGTVGPQSDYLFDGAALSRSVDAITVSTERHAYICSPADRPSELYDLQADPRQQQDIADQDQDPETAKDPPPRGRRVPGTARSGARSDSAFRGTGRGYPSFTQYQAVGLQRRPRPVDHLQRRGRGAAYRKLGCAGAQEDRRGDHIRARAGRQPPEPGADRSVLLGRRPGLSGCNTPRQARYSLKYSRHGVNRRRRETARRLLCRRAARRRRTRTLT